MNKHKEAKQANVLCVLITSRLTLFAHNTNFTVTRNVLSQVVFPHNIKQSASFGFKPKYLISFYHISIFLLQKHRKLAAKVLGQPKNTAILDTSRSLLIPLGIAGSILDSYPGHPGLSPGLALSAFNTGCALVKIQLEFR